jgi:hypothetical protein
MMKNFMISGTFSKGRKPRRDGGSAVPILGEAEVMTIFN